MYQGLTQQICLEPDTPMKQLQICLQEGKQQDYLIRGDRHGRNWQAMCWTATCAAYYIAKPDKPYALPLQIWAVLVETQNKTVIAYNLKRKKYAQFPLDLVLSVGILPTRLDTVVFSSEDLSKIPELYPDWQGIDNEDCYLYD